MLKMIIQTNDLFSMILKFNKIAVLVLFLCLFCSANILAQGHDEHVTIKGSFQPTLRDFGKLSVAPEIETNAFEIGETIIQPIDTVLASNIELELITPLNLKTENAQPNFQNYLLAGFGSRVSPVFVYKHNSNLSKNIAFGLGISHHSSWMNKNEYAPSSFMNNQIDLNLDNKLNNYTLHSKAFYANEMVHYYGFKPIDYPVIAVDNELITQKYQTFNISSGLQSSRKSNGGLYHEATINYQYFSDKFKSSEHAIVMNASAEKAYKWLKSKDKQFIAVETGLNSYINGDSVSGTNNFRFNIVPSVRLSGDYYQLKLGVNLDLHTNDHSPVYIFPAIESGLFLFERNLKFYANLGGNSQFNGYQQLAKENPFVSSVLPLEWKNTSLKFQGGMKALLFHDFDIHIGVEYSNIKNESFFVTDSTSVYSNKFTLFYDDVKWFTFLAEVGYSLTEKLELKSVYRYNKIQLHDLTAPFYQPTNQFNLLANYTFDEKLRFNASVYYVGERFASTYASGLETIHTLKPFVDLNLGGLYKINDSFEVFAQLNNLLNWQYQRFYNYPVNGFELYAGITVRF